jgi:hypothetical protein
MITLLIIIVIGAALIAILRALGFVDQRLMTVIYIVFALVLFLYILKMFGFGPGIPIK